MQRPSSISGSTDYHYLVVALKTQWVAFVKLREEFQNYTLPNPEDWRPKQEAEFQRMRPINPEASDDELRRVIDSSLGVHLPVETLRDMKYSDSVMGLYATVALLSHALCEALTNHVIGCGLAQAGIEDVFSLVEGASIAEKCTVAPKAISSAYSFPQGSALDATIKRVTRHRNALVHYKGELRFDGRTVLKGKKLIAASLEERLIWIHRYFSLPFDLSRHFEQALPDLRGFTRIIQPHPIELVTMHQRVL